MESDPDSPPASPPTETAASSIVNLFFNEVNKQDVSGLLHVQSSLLEQLDKSNEILEGTNRISAKRYLDATREYANHTQLLVTMKTDLDSIFQRIRVLKTRLNKKYPEAYASVIEMHNQHDSLDDEDDDIVPPMKSMGNSSLVKSKTIDCSQLPPSMRETYSLAQISQTTVDQSPSSFDTVRRFVYDKSSSGGQELSSLFKTARDELRKINEGFLGSSNQKSSTSQEE
ncbi:unnamed protein product [Adineta ricciae]|uniref:KxDL domain-containing protein n=1 Tax=Adineta ricciae TaxID=249248 RepID=A0A815IYY6_ADIRI|nr:unnamed protein product [Adineta ricciae]